MVDRKKSNHGGQSPGLLGQDEDKDSLRAVYSLVPAVFLTGSKRGVKGAIARHKQPRTLGICDGQRGGWDSGCHGSLCRDGSAKEGPVGMNSDVGEGDDAPDCQPDEAKAWRRGPGLWCARECGDRREGHRTLC